VLGDHGEEIAQQGPLVVGQLRGALALWRWRLGGDGPGADPGVALAVRGCLRTLRAPARWAPDLDLPAPRGLGPRTLGPRAIALGAGAVLRRALLALGLV